MRTAVLFRMEDGVHAKLRDALIASLLGLIVGGTEELRFSCSVGSSLRNALTTQLRAIREKENFD